MRWDTVNSLIAAILMVIPVAINGNAPPSPTPATPVEATTEVTQLPPGAPCPASPAVEDVVPGQRFVSGADPIWVASVPPPVEWSDFPKSLPPYAGALWKTLFYIREEAFGDMELHATQLDGDGIVLFPLNGAQGIEEDGVFIGNEIRLDLGEPVETHIVPADYRRFHAYAVSGGYVQVGALLLVPHPGCYQLTAAIGADTVNIVYDIQS